MDDFDELVLSFMCEYGVIATYIQIPEGVYDTATGENVVTPVEIPVEALQLDLPLTRNGASTQNGTLIQDGDKQFFVRPPNKTDCNAAPLVVNPAADKLRIGSVEWNIITFKEINTTGNNQILIELYVRR